LSILEQELDFTLPKVTLTVHYRYLIDNAARFVCESWPMCSLFKRLNEKHWLIVFHCKSENFWTGKKTVSLVDFCDWF